MKTFITSFLLFFTLSLFAQPQKGDLYVGFSNLGVSNISSSPNALFRIRNTALFVAPSFGKFIGNNTLVGGGFAFNTIFSFTSFRVNLFSTQYFGKGRLKGLGQISLNSNLRSDEFNRRSIRGEFALGAAYFVNEFTSLQLTYNINIFETIEGLNTEYFTSGIDPNIGLSIRTILLRNREGIENLSALNSIKKGTTLIGTTGGLFTSSFRNSNSINGSFSRFFLDGFYAGMGFFSSRSKDVEDDFITSNLNFNLHLGAYFRISEKLYTKFSTELSTGRSINNSRFGFFLDQGNPKITTSFLRANSEFALAFFLGRHKLESGAGFRFSSTKMKELSPDRMQDASPNFFIRHEWFLAENFAFTSAFNTRFNDTFYSVGFTNFSPSGGQDLDIIEFSQNTLRLTAGFKWYFSTPTE